MRLKHHKNLIIIGLDKVTIICPKHGEFEQVLKSHMNGYGCKYCSYDKKKLSDDEVLRIIRDNNLELISDYESTFER